MKNNNNNNAFTLIELIATLVIISLITLIVIPLILNTIRKAKEQANRRSIDNYGRIVETAMAEYQSEYLKYPSSIDELQIEYVGSVIECETRRINSDNSIYLSECKVNGKPVKNSKEEDGWYHYGKLILTDKEYVDLFGKNIELALKDYYKENNKYPVNYRLLELPQLDKEVNCTSQINYDGTVYLTKCSVDGELVKDNNDDYYSYGSITYKSYKIGDKISFSGVNWYVIANSGRTSDYVTLMRENVLTHEELGEYGATWTCNSWDKANSWHGCNYKVNTVEWDTMGYYWDDTCHNERVYGYTQAVTTGCSGHIDYNSSKINDFLTGTYINSLDPNKLKYVDGYNIRLPMVNEIENVLEREKEWLYILNESKGVYGYWTMTPTQGSTIQMRIVSSNSLSNLNIYLAHVGVRPVINVYKSYL